MKFLILTASAGNGHNSTAKKLRDKILKEIQGSDVKIVDMYKSFASKTKAWILDQGYAFACKHLLKAYNYFFKKSEKSNYQNRDKAKVHNEVAPMLKGVLDEIYSYQPDVIICTYIFCAVAVCDLTRCYKIPAKIVCMTLDYGVSPYWECTNALDKMFITNDDMIQPFLDRGFKKEQLVVAGIPIDDDFSKSPEPEDLAKRREKCGIENKFTLLIMRNSFFPYSNTQLFKEFEKIKSPIQIVFASAKGKDKQDLERRILKSKTKHTFKLFGFVEDLALLFKSCDILLSKAGGLTTTEALTSKLPMLIIDDLPQQEIYNKQYMVKNGCALSVDKTNSISKQINSIIENNEIYSSMKNNIERVRKTFTLQPFIEYFKTCSTADYSNIEIKKLSKRQVASCITKKRKEAIKTNK